MITVAYIDEKDEGYAFEVEREERFMRMSNLVRYIGTDRTVDGRRVRKGELFNAWFDRCRSFYRLDAGLVVEARRSSDRRVFSFEYANIETLMHEWELA